MKLEASYIETLMKAALAEAKIAFDAGEVPVGASIGYNGGVIASAGNAMERLRDATAHAEMLALRQASEVLDAWRLRECVVCVTLEPCTMCAAAIKLARLPVVVFGLSDLRAGALGSIYNLADDKRWGESLRVVSGIYEKESRELLQLFFQSRRSQPQVH